MKKSSQAAGQNAALKNALQTYQAARLRATYADIVAIPQYRLLGEFFFEQIYGPKDFGFRNSSIKSLHRRMSGLLHGEIIEAVGTVVELNDLTERLDEQMVQVMVDEGMGPQLTEEQYERLYRACENYADRVAQIQLLITAVRGIYAVSQMRMIGLSLRLVRGAAHLAGFGEIMNFLEEGYAAFRSVKDIQFFLDTVQERETARNDRIFGVSGENSPMRR